MDKETLSNYGWIVIAVLVLAVMIALATPFGSYISSAVKSTTAGLFSTSQNAMNQTGLINIDNQQFDGDPIVRSGKILKSAKYTLKATGTVLEGNGTNTLPDVPAAGDVYEEGDYKYTYNPGQGGYSVYGTEWSVKVKDTSKTSYGEILSEIAGKPVTHMTYTFINCTSLAVAPIIPNSVTDMTYTLKGCTSLTSSPVIPNSVTKMDSTFYGCTSLATAPEIPNSVTSMSFTFADCTSLKTAPVIPNTVWSMSYTFRGCTSLTTAPVIPRSVTNICSTFSGCTSLVGAIEVNSNPTTYDSCLKDTQITEITGSTTMKAKILATKNQQKPVDPWF